MSNTPASNFAKPGQPGKPGDGVGAGPAPLPRRVLHLVGAVTPEVLSFLAPATHALARAGLAQQVLAIGPHPVPDAAWGLHPDVGLRNLGTPGSALKRWWGALATLRPLRAGLAAEGPALLHVHGCVPALVAALVMLRAAGRVRLVYSPHGSRALNSRWLGWLCRRLPLASAVAGHAAEARLLPTQTSAPVHLAESPTARVFFDARPIESEQPCVVAGVLDHPADASREVARLAVLLGGEKTQPRVTWLGLADPGALSVLRAAGVSACTDDDTDSQAALLASAWVFVAPTPCSHFPVLLARAMAVGLPCVALDVPFHRSLIVHGHSGYLCADMDALVQHVAALLESYTLRVSLGAAAREAARERFAQARFDAALLAAYGVQDGGSAAPRLPQRAPAGQPMPV